MIGVRHVQALLLFFNAAVLYINRLHLAVTILAMTKKEENNSTFVIFNWNEKQKSLILSSFYWGYVISQIPSGYLVRRFDVKLTLFVSTLSTGLLTLITPFCVAKGGWRTLCYLRAWQGLFQGCHYPAFQQHLAKWSPLSERSMLNGLSTAGYSCGKAMAILLAGLIASTDTLGWPGTFYIFSTMCFVWCILWWFFAANDFNSSKFIKSAERLHIANSLQQSVHFGAEKLKIPWRKLLTSMPFWSVLIVRSLTSIGFYALYYNQPTYMHAIFKLNIRKNALLSTLPYIVQWLAIYVYMFIGDLILRRKIFNLTTMRKIFNSFGLWLSAAIAIWIAFVDAEQQILVVILFIILMGVFIAVVMGSAASLIDIAPNHVVIMTVFQTTLGSIANILCTLSAGFIITNEENRSQWAVLFFMVAAAFALGDLAFLIWGTAREQDWNSIALPKPGAEQVLQSNNVDGSLKAKEQINLAFLDDSQKSL